VTPMIRRPKIYCRFLLFRDWLQWLTRLAIPFLFLMLLEFSVGLGVLALVGYEFTARRGPFYNGCWLWDKIGQSRPDGPAIDGASPKHVIEVGVGIQVIGYGVRRKRQPSYPTEPRDRSTINSGDLSGSSHDMIRH